MNQTYNSLWCVLRRPGEWLGEIQKAHCSPKLKDYSSVSGLRASFCFFLFYFFFFFAFFFCEFLSWCSVGFVRINDHNIDSTSFILFSLPVSFLYNLFIWVTLTPHIVAIIPLCIKHINNRIKVAILFPHILNSEDSIY